MDETIRILDKLQTGRQQVDTLVKGIERLKGEAFNLGQQIDAAIRMIGGIPRGHKRRGRKSMCPEERLRVSARMHKYWDMRHAAEEAARQQDLPLLH
jgi:hypothetical protein